MHWYMLVCAAFSVAGCGDVGVSAKTERLRDVRLRAPIAPLATR